MGKKRGNGEGSIYYSASRKTYVGQIILCGKRRSVYGKTKKEVASKLKELETEAQGGYLAEKTDYTVAELIREIIEQDHKKGKTGTSAYVRKLASLKSIEKRKIAKLSVAEITEKQVDDFLIERAKVCADSTLRKEYSLIKRCLKEAAKRHYRTDNFIEDYERPKSRKPTRKVRALTSDEQQAFITYLRTEKPKYTNQYMLMMLTGMRMGEVNALKSDDIDFVSKKIYVERSITADEKDRPVIGYTTKTYAGRRTLSITPSVDILLKKCLLEQRPNKNNLIFFNQLTGAPYRTSTINNAFVKLLNDKRIIRVNVRGKVSLHSLRHTFATRCIESGMPAEVLQKLLGHKDVSITINTYCDIFDAYKDKYIHQANAYLLELGLNIS